MRKNTFNILCLTVLIVHPSASFGSDLAVERLQRDQPVTNRSQIMTADQIRIVADSTALAEAIMESSGDSEHFAMKTIPEGIFLSGDSKVEVNIDWPYLLDLTEVSNADYREFMRSIGAQVDPQSHAHPSEPGTNSYQPRYWGEYLSPLFRRSPAAQVAPFSEDTFTQDESPVVGVDWWDAYAYCSWAEKRLPTALEWEKGARGQAGNIWPWGNSWDYTKANSGGDKWGEVDGFIYAAPVVSFGGGASPYGLLNMAGNVSEWTHEAVLMGGSSNSRPSGVRGSFREKREREYKSFNIGFRCAMDVQNVGGS